ncbi:MAG: hypothetical protein N2Z79_03615 [Candidatus Omnitrophica bacterium]|nr:hypothetical protein [Candidatus Omnitrophota bacterium]
MIGVLENINFIPKLITYSISLYSLKRNKTCGVIVVYKDGAMNSAQAKSIIASLEFSTIDR